MPVRLILLLLLAALVYSVVRKYQRHRERGRPRSESPAEDMVRCAQCGIHLPRSEGILSAQQIFCCVEHRDAYQR